MSEENSFLLVDFTAKAQETGELVDTTDAEVAKKMNAYEENQVYEPRLFIIGAGGIPKIFENKLKEASINEKYEVTITPEEGYGQRDPSKVRVYPIRKFAGVKNLEVGARLDIEGKMGTVKSISSGRVSVDFNPPLAGKTLTYEFKITSKIEDDLAKAKAILNRRFPKLKEKTFDVELSGDVVTIKLPEEVYYLEGLPIMKRAVFSDLSKYVKSVNRILFIEEYAKEKVQKPTEEKPAIETPKAEEKAAVEGKAEETKAPS